MKRYEFPKGFLWGVAAGSYQIEGAWNEDGKGEGIWDRLVHTPGRVKDGTNADVGVDFYHRYNKDIEMMSELGYQSFLYTISWPRVIPKGTGEINPKGFEYYRSVLKKCKDMGIHTMMALYHWDLPQALQDRGGWTNRDIVGWFTDYAKTCYRELGDLVDDWITFVEPYSVLMGYFGIPGWMFAPGHADNSEALLAGHHMNMCHGAAVKAFRESGLKGRIGIKEAITLGRPKDPNSSADIEAARKYSLMSVNFYLDPILKGRYPEELMNAYRMSGFVLPEIRKGDMELMCQPIDFFGFNSYSATVCTAAATPLGFIYVPPGSCDTDVPLTSYDWAVFKDSFYIGLRYVYDNYKDAIKEVIITESGCASNDWVAPDGTVSDPNRIIYLKNDLRQIFEAIADGVPITGYHTWSLFDNFEWLEGFSKRFGLIYINYKTLERIPKASAYWYSDVIKNNAFEV